MKVLFVCSGNICRSAMAAEYFRHRAAQSGLSHIVVDSAGTLDINGSPASPEAVEVLSEIGVDLSAHRSRGIRASDLQTADLVVAMTRDHLEELAHRFPHGDGERMILRSFEQGSRADPDAPDLEDPIGQPVEFYREQRSILTRCLDHLVLHLRHSPRRDRRG
jgi:protein-tyrosine-phosphatase